MNRGVFLGVLLALILLISRPSWSRDSFTLNQCFDLALKRSEVLAVQQELINQAQQRVKQAQGSILPTVNFVTTYQLQDSTGQTGVVGAFAQAEQTTVRINGQQPLFRGLREFATLKAAKSSEKASESDLARARMNLFNDVATAFYAVKTAEQDVANLKELKRLTEEREKELDQRRRIGRSRLSEVLTVQTQSQTLNSQIALAQGQLSIARETLAFLTGSNATMALEDSISKEPTSENLSRLLDSLNDRPDIQAAHSRVESAEQSIWAVKGGHLPSVDLGGNYYFKRPGILRETKWDLQINVTFPLFAGGTIVSQTSEAVSRHKQAELDAARLKRSAELEVRQSFENFSALKRQVETLKEALKVSEKNYHTQNQEYRLGLVTNLDVLQALNSFLETKRTYDRSAFAWQQESVRLANLAGHGPAFRKE